MTKRFRSFIAVILALVMLVLMVGTASANAATTTNEPVGATQKAMFIMDTVNISQGMNGSYSHQGSKAIDLAGKDSGIDPAYAPFDGKVVYMSTSAAYIIYQSLNPVEFADGTVDYMTVWVMHDDNVGRFYVGQTFSQGQHFFNEGSSGYATGNHIHLECARGTYQGQYKNSSGVWCINNQINPYDALFLSESTNIISGYGYNWRRTNAVNNLPYSVNINDGDAISGDSFPITGSVTNGGKYPWLHLYVDYGWVADTANNSLGNYAFYLDTTKYSDGQHLLGVKITNDDGLDYTTWRTIYIDNTKPMISATYISEVTDYSYRVCCAVNDNIAVSKVRVATWTQSDQSDLIWHDCNYNGVGTYFYDCNKSDYALGATQYFNHIYAYDKANNYAFGEQVATFDKPYSLFKSTYYSEISETKFRVCCEMNNPNDIEKVRIATWATANQTDVIWHDCNYNGVGTYFYDINRSDYASGLNTYISHVYAYSKSGKCDVVEKRLTYENKPPIISDITISERSSKGFRISCKVEDDNSIKKVEFPTWLANNEQHDLIWYRAEIKDGIATCYIPISDHNNEFGTYFTHIYAYDIFNNLSTERVTIELSEPKCGDTNLDGIISIGDVTAIQRHLAELEVFTDEQLDLADTDGDGKINIADATHLQMYLAEYDVVLGKQTT